MAHALEIIFSFVILAISIIAVLGNLSVFQVITPVGPPIAAPLFEAAGGDD